MPVQAFWSCLFHVCFSFGVNAELVLVLSAGHVSCAQFLRCLHAFPSLPPVCFPFFPCKKNTEVLRTCYEPWWHCIPKTSIIWLCRPNPSAWEPWFENLDMSHGVMEGRHLIYLEFAYSFLFQCFESNHFVNPVATIWRNKCFGQYFLCNGKPPLRESWKHVLFPSIFSGNSKDS